MEPWTEKYRPKRLDEVLGNPSAVANLRDWARTWSGGSQRLKAVVLSGAPGTGKTSAALALAAEMGWDVVELNASDLRNAEAVERILGRAATMQTFGPDGFMSTKEGRRKLILFDEADNLHGRDDSGGAGAIVRVIQSSAQPIILTVNDYYEMARRSPALRSIALKVDFRGLQSGSMAKRLGAICAAEGVSVPNDVLLRLAEQSRGDMRAALNDLQGLAQGREVVPADAPLQGERDIVGDEFKVTQRILFTQSAGQAIDAYRSLDSDPERFILWLDSNVPVLYSGEDMARGFERLSRADMFLGRTRRRQMYSLWSYAGEIMTAGVAAAKTAKPEFRPLQFPSWLQQMSRSRESRKIRDSVALKLGRLMHCSRAEVSESLLPFLKRMLAADAELAARVEIEMELEAAESEFLLGKAPKEKEPGEEESAEKPRREKKARKKREGPAREVEPKKETAAGTDAEKPKRGRKKKAEAKGDGAKTSGDAKSEKPDESHSSAPKSKPLKQVDLSKYGGKAR